MNTNDVMLGMFVGVIAISLFTPILSLYGFNQHTSIILLYSLPFVGAASIVVADVLGNRQESSSTGSSHSEKYGKTRESQIGRLLGKSVVVHTKIGGSYKGWIRGVDNELLILGDAVRLDVPDGNRIDHIFIEKNDIKRIESSAVSKIIEE